jgi:hypothetical protein
MPLMGRYRITTPGRTRTRSSPRSVVRATGLCRHGGQRQGEGIVNDRLPSPDITLVTGANVVNIRVIRSECPSDRPILTH